MRQKLMTWKCGYRVKINTEKSHLAQIQEGFQRLESNDKKYRKRNRKKPFCTHVKRISGLRVCGKNITSL